MTPVGARGFAVIALAAAAGGAACGGAHEGAPSTASASSSCGDGSQGAPRDLACTGLFTDATLTAISADARAYTPSAPLWSDGASKRRFVYLPPGEPIDTSDPDAWVFPVGTKAWKEFTVLGKKIETRFWWKTSPTRWVRATYVWSDDETSARREDQGVPNARGTGFDVPKIDDCDGCHDGKKDRLLGLDAIGLGAAGAAGVTLASLAAEGRLTAPPPPTSLAFGDATSAPALAWLHVNCGVACHNDSASASASDTGLRLRLEVDRAWAVSADELLATTISAPATMPAHEGAVRVVPGRSDRSLLVELVSTRGQGQMPPVGTNAVDDAGVAAVRAWIDALPPPRAPASLAPAPTRAPSATK